MLCCCLLLPRIGSPSKTPATPASFLLLLLIFFVILLLQVLFSHSGYFCVPLTLEDITLRFSATVAAILTLLLIIQRRSCQTTTSPVVTLLELVSSYESSLITKVAAVQLIVCTDVHLVSWPVWGAGVGRQGLRAIT